MAIDMWSFGCILAELYTGIPIFPGEDEGDQLACIIELLGMPSQKLIEQSKRARNFISSKGYPRYCSVTLQDDQVVLGPGKSKRNKIRGTPGSKSWGKALKECDDPVFIDFLKGCLQWDPEKRFQPSQAFRHDWIRKRTVRPGDEPTSHGVSNGHMSHSQTNNKMSYLSTGQIGANKQNSSSTMTLNIAGMTNGVTGVAVPAAMGDTKLTASSGRIANSFNDISNISQQHNSHSNALPKISSFHKN